jgi:hypothetical protein
VIAVEVAAESWRSTVQATPLRPLLVVVSGLMLVGLVTSWRSAALPDALGIVGVGALAGALALGLDDEANAVLRSSPTSALGRLAHRLTILVPALLAASGALVVVERFLFAERSALPSAWAFAALVAAGVAVEVWWSRRRPETAAQGAATFVMVWVLAVSLVPDVWILGRVAVAWQLDAPWVLGASLVLAVCGALGRGA